MKFKRTRKPLFLCTISSLIIASLFIGSLLIGSLLIGGPLIGTGGAAEPQKDTGRNTDGVAGFRFTWDKEVSGDFTFSIVNNLDDPITHVKIQVVFYDYTGVIVDFQEIDITSALPPGLAKRMRGKVDASTQLIVQEANPKIIPKIRGKEEALKWLQTKDDKGRETGWVEIKICSYKKSR